MKLSGMFLSLAVAVPLVAALAACGATPESPPSPGPTVAPKPGAVKADWEQKWESALAGARKEGVVSVYGTMAREGIVGMAAKLKDRFDIELEALAGREAELIQKMLLERRAGIRTVDMILLPPMGYIDHLKPGGLVTPLTPYLILPDVKDDKNWLNGRFPWFDKDRTVVALGASYVSYILVNTEAVKEGEIRSFQDLLKPGWKGKMIMLDPTFIGSTNTFVNYVVPRVLGLEGGEAFLRELVKQDITYTRDARLIVESVAKRKYPIAIGASTSIVGDFIAAGAPISFVRPEEGAPLLPASTCLSIAADPPHPNAATVVLNWLLTEEGQAVFSAGRNSPPRRLGVPFTSADQFAVVRPGDKTFEVDEAFYLEGQKTSHWAKDIFGPAVSK